MNTSTINALAAMILLASTSPAMAETPDHDEIISEVDSLSSDMTRVSRAVWSYAELGYQETQSTNLLQTELRKAGFTVESGLAGMPTSFIGHFRNGDGEGPTIGILAEFDALPGLAQAAVPIRSVLESHAAGHGCGHNMFGSASLSAAIAVKAWMVEHDIQGEIRVYGTPAEEGGGAKVYMARAGLFDDVDAVIHWHPADENSARQDLAMANISGKFRFRGVAAHAASHPDLGRSALDGVELMDVAVQFLREHVPETVRIHHVITSGGSAPNVVPDFAESYYYVRDWDPVVVRDVLARVRKAADGAAMATETQVEFELINGVFGLLPNDILGRLIDANLREVGGPQWTQEDREFAEQIRETLINPDPLDSGQNVVPYSSGDKGLGSTDVGDVSWVVPTVGIRVATYAPGTSAHSWQATAQAGSSFGEKGMIVASKTMAITAADLFSNPELLTQARAEFDERRGPGFTYQTLIGDRTPPLNYREGQGDN